MKYKPMPPIEMLREMFTLDAASGKLIRKLSSGGELAGSVAGGKTSAYPSVNVMRSLYLVHRVIYFMATGVDPIGFKVDHRNGDTSDRRPSNLRLATQSENGCHRVKMDSRNTSGHRGVYWSKKDNLWIARVYKSKKKVHCSYHKRLEDAAAAADAARAVYMGAFKGVAL